MIFENVELIAKVVEDTNMWLAKRIHERFTRKMK